MVLTAANIKEFACHLKTLGAYVQQPIPAIVGLSDYQAIGSQDAKSLYPTIMVLGNIGFDTLYGRVYDTNIVGKIIQYIEHSFMDKKNIKPAVAGFENALKMLLKTYTKNNDTQKKNDFIDFTVSYYPKLFKSIISYGGRLEDIYTPRDDETYFLLKSCLYPILEAITWLHENNRGYNSTIIDWVFYNSIFSSKYTNQPIYILENINSVKISLKKYTGETIPYVFNNFLLNSYGTLFYKHDDKKSIEVDLILQGMDDRGFIKNQGLILKAITSNWNNIQDDLKKGLFCSTKIDNLISTKIIDIVGDSDQKTKEGQLFSLESIIFNTVELDSIEQLYNRLTLMAAQKDSESNGVKVTLNSGYGIYAMATWNYGNSLIANSITNAGKIYGIKLFQQIASNILTEEQQKIAGGL
jgi:DNA polymerase elongation subunit (family B)